MVTGTKNNLKLKVNRGLEIGDILEGQVISKKKNEIYIDLSPYGVGRVYGIFYLQSKKLAQKIKIGDRVGIKIVGLNDGYGNYEIILQNVQEVNKWQKILKYYQKGVVFEVEVKKANRGGLIVEIDNIPAFIPVSHLSPEYYPRVGSQDKNLIYEHLKKLVGQKIKCKIVSANPKTNKLILSEKATKEEVYQKILDNYTVGEVLSVKVISLSPFGIFVRFHENPPLDGLIHISEIPEEKLDLEKYFKVGDIIKAKLIQIKQDRVNFSLRDLTEDPWVAFVKKYKEGDKIMGGVKEKNNIFGVIITENNVQGFIFEKLENLEIGQKYEFIIEKITPREKSLILRLND